MMPTNTSGEARTPLPAVDPSHPAEANRARSLLATALLSLAFTATQAQTAMQALAPGERLQTDLLQATVPDSPGWQLAAKAPARIALARSAGGPQDSLAAFVMGFRIAPTLDKDAFMTAVRQGAEADTPAERFRAMKADWSHVDTRAAPCVQSVTQHEDTQARLRSGATGTLLLHAVTLYCQHPQMQGVAYAVGYSYRGEQPYAPLEAEAQRFIAGAGLRVP